MYNCEDIFDKTDDYLDGNLSDFECADFENHLKNCENCKKSVDFAREINNVMHSMPPIEPPKNLTENLHRKINKSKKAAFYRKWQPYSALAACIILAVVVKSNAVKDLNETTSYLDLSTPVPTVLRQTNEPFVKSEDEIADYDTHSETAAIDIYGTPDENTAAPTADKSIDTPAPTSISTSISTSTPTAMTATVSEENSDIGHSGTLPDNSSEELKIIQSENEGQTKKFDGEEKQDIQSEENAAADNPSVMSLTQSDIAEVYEQAADNAKQADAETNGGFAKASVTSSSSAKSGGSGGGNSAKARVNKISAENKEKVLEIAERLGIIETDDTYTASESAYNEFLTALENEGIEFDGIYTYDNGKIRFIVKWI